MATYSSQLNLIFEALANEHRREIVHAVSLQPCSITQLANMRDLSLPAIHKHITLLEQAHLVHTKKVGRTTYLTLKRNALQTLQQWVMQYHPYWGHDDATHANYSQYFEDVAKKEVNIYEKITM